MKFIYSKEEFLKSQMFSGFKTKQQYQNEINLYNVSQEKNMFVLEVEGGFPTYEEYIEFYSKESNNFCEMFMEQTKQLGEFQIWLRKNKDKTFTYDEINQKLLELKLSFDGFNGDFELGEN